MSLADWFYKTCSIFLKIVDYFIKGAVTLVVFCFVGIAIKWLVTTFQEFWTFAFFIFAVSVVGWIVNHLMKAFKEM